MFNSHTFPDFASHGSPLTPTAPAGDETGGGSQSAREADGEGDAENEEDRSEGGFGPRCYRRRLFDTS